MPLLEAHQLGQHQRARNDRNAAFTRRDHFRVVGLHRRRHDDDIGARDVVGMVAAGDAHPQPRQARGHRVCRQVRAADFVAEIGQDFGDAAHPGAADADKVYAFDLVFHRFAISSHNAATRLVASGSAKCARGNRHGQQAPPVESAQQLREGLGRQIGLRQMDRRAGFVHVGRVVALVAGRRYGERHQDARHSGGREFGDRDGAGTAKHDIGRRIARGHVVDERQDFRLDIRGGIRRAHRIGLVGAGLMHDHGPLAAGQQAHGFGQRSIERLRAQAAAHHQQPERTGPALVAEFGRRQRRNFRPHRIAGHMRTHSILPRCDGREAERKAIRERRQEPVRQQQRGVGVVDDERDVGQACHHAARNGAVAAHAKHHIGLSALEDAPALPHREQQPQAAGQRMQQALAAQAAEPDHVQRNAVFGHQRVFHPRFGSQPSHVPAASAQLVRDSQSRHDVSAGAGRHDHQGPAHPIVPRSSPAGRFIRRTRAATAGSRSRSGAAGRWRGSWRRCRCRRRTRAEA